MAKYHSSPWSIRPMSRAGPHRDGPIDAIAAVRIPLYRPRPLSRSVVRNAELDAGCHARAARLGLGLGLLSRVPPSATGQGDRLHGGDRDAATLVRFSFWSRSDVPRHAVERG